MKHNTGKWKFYDEETLRRVKMANEFYFQMCLTECEHEIVEDMVRKVCNDNNLELIYYRELKSGHIPTYREIKVRGENLGLFKQWLKDEKASIYFNIYMNELDKTPLDSKPLCKLKSKESLNSCNECYEKNYCCTRCELRL